MFSEVGLGGGGLNERWEGGHSTLNAGGEGALGERGVGKKGNIGGDCALLGCGVGGAGG